ncbi:MAG: M20/M25/M40 family metallo-hydrolase [Chloroflexi bacterium]|nr:M20/M25/M40 family metallo-hydrolase [Chloroflexota bacterium]
MTSDIDRVLSQIDKEELADLVLAICNVDAPSGHERAAGEFIEGWLRQEGFKTRVLGLVPERPNVVGTRKGTGGGYSLLFNSHMDTFPSEQEVWSRRDCKEPMDHGAWREGDMLWGMPVVNDRGPMACFLTAARAIKKAGIALKGDLLLTTVSGELGREPVDEFQGPVYADHDIGARYMVAHGAVADYALVAECTDFHVTWLEAGRAVYKITLFTVRSFGGPFLKRPYTVEKNPNAVIPMARLIEKLEDWALTYEQKHTYVCPAGTLIPKVSIGAVRGGSPYFTYLSSELASVYVELWTPPNLDVLAMKSELENLVHSLGMEGKVELTAFRRGHEAQNIDRLLQAIDQAHGRLFNKKVETVVGPICSMWRDVNVFNEAGIPAATYGPGVLQNLVLQANRGLSLESLYQTAQVYATVALDICNQEKKA